MMNMKNLRLKPQGIKAKYCPDYLLKAATKAWDDAVEWEKNMVTAMHKLL